jgi:putative Holliday junction resolvase
MRVLGLDLGSRRIGVALSDPDGAIASPLTTLERRGGARDLAAVEALVREHEVGEVVVGLPLHMDGRRGPEAEAAKRFAAELRATLGVPVGLLDERWTTVEAERALRESGRKGKKRRAVVDAVAASILLRTWLERRRAGAARSAGSPGAER